MNRRRSLREVRRAQRPDGSTSVVREPFSTQLLDVVDKAVITRWTAAQERARELPGGRDERVEAVTAKIRRELGVAGAASGGTAAIPGVGFGTASATFVVELSWSTLRLADLILTIAAIHGHDRSDVEERRLWVLSILTYREGAASMVAKLAQEMAQSSNQTGRRRLSPRTMKRINTSMGRAVVAKFGARRGVAALGRAVPFGIGAVLGYGMNSKAVTVTAKHAHAFFTDFPIALDAIDTEGQLIPRDQPGRAADSSRQLAPGSSTQ